jgi:hypothetical protein
LPPTWHMSTVNSARYGSCHCCLVDTMKSIGEKLVVSGNVEVRLQQEPEMANCLVGASNSLKKRQRLESSESLLLITPQHGSLRHLLLGTSWVGERSGWTRWRRCWLPAGHLKGSLHAGSQGYLEIARAA